MYCQPSIAYKVDACKPFKSCYFVVSFIICKLREIVLEKKMKNVTLKISGGEFGMPEDAEGNVEIITEGKLYKRNGKTYLRYDELPISGLEGCVTTLIMDNERVKMKRSGDDRGTGEIVFEKGKRYFSEYETPMGILPLEVLTNHVNYRLNEDGYGDVDIDYHISLDGLIDGRNMIKISVSE